MSSRELVTAGLGGSPAIVDARRQSASVSEHLSSASCSKLLRCSLLLVFCLLASMYMPLAHFFVPIFHGARSQCARPQLHQYCVIIILLIAANCVCTS